MRELQEAAASGANALADLLRANRDDGSIIKKNGKYILDPIKFKSRLES